MPPAARLTDKTDHGGTIMPLSPRTVFIGGQPAAVQTDQHVCSMPPVAHPPSVSPFTLGSPTVFIGGVAALRVGDACGCGASPLVGDPTVIIA